MANQINIETESDPTPSILVIWVKHFQNKLMIEIYSESLVRAIGIVLLTTRTPAVTDVFRSGRNVGALRPGRRVGFR